MAVSKSSLPERQLNFKNLILGTQETGSISYGIAKNTEDWLPVMDIKNGTVFLKDGRFIKLAEITPVNFYLKSFREQEAQYKLGLHFANPNECEVDIAKAFFWFSESANQGLADAQYRLADFYENIKRDLPNAIKWYRAAAEQGHLETVY